MTFKEWEETLPETVTDEMGINDDASMIWEAATLAERERCVGLGGLLQDAYLSASSGRTAQEEALLCAAVSDYAEAIRKGDEI